MAEFNFEKQWAELWMKVTTGMAEWRQQHPRATFREIEAALDERMNRARAKFLADAATGSRLAGGQRRREAGLPGMRQPGPVARGEAETVTDSRWRIGTSPPFRPTSLTPLAASSYSVPGAKEPPHIVYQTVCRLCSL